jgi:hypothetical protein
MTPEHLELCKQAGLTHRLGIQLGIELEKLIYLAQAESLETMIPIAEAENWSYSFGDDLRHAAAQKRTLANEK